jgi:predicted transposase YdaD
MERDTQRKADEILNDYVEKKYREAVEKTQSVWEYCDISKLVDMVNDVNSWSSFIAGDDRDLYEDFKLHVYFQDGHVYILRGKELND